MIRLNIDQQGQSSDEQAEKRTMAYKGHGGIRKLGLATRNQDRESLEKMVRGYGNNFYWVAGATLINLGLTLSGSSLYFSLGLWHVLIVSMITVSLSNEIGGGGGVVVWVIGVGVALTLIGLFLLLGFLCKKRYRWAAMVGAVIYTADALIIILTGEWLTLVVRLFILVFFWHFTVVLKVLREMETVLPPPPEIVGSTELPGSSDLSAPESVLPAAVTQTAVGTPQVRSGEPESS